jgi:cellulose synthase operon protein C
MRTDIKRMADGSYTVRLNPYWYRLDTATAFDGSAVKLDPVRSFASLASDVRLTPVGQGSWRQEVSGPLMIRHHMVRLES